MLIDSADDVRFHLRDDASGANLVTRSSNHEEHYLSKRSTRSRQLCIDGFDLWIVEASSAVFVYLLRQDEEGGPRLGIVGIDFNQVERLFLQAEKDGAPLGDLQNLCGWFLQRVAGTLGKVYQSRLVVPNDRGLQKKKALHSFYPTFKGLSSNSFGEKFPLQASDRCGVQPGLVKSLHFIGG